jgi:outer membrane protein OmpA-like peptidoglycan-associated protein
MRSCRLVPALMAALLMAACQTTGAFGLSNRQVAVLKANGFVQTERGWEFDVSGKYLFPTDQSALTDEQKTGLDAMAKALHAVAIDGARVEGHADSTGNAAYNEALSLRRAQSVAGALVTGGMDAQKVSGIGLGAQDPIESNATAAGRKENRRVVIIVGGM